MFNIGDLVEYVGSEEYNPASGLIGDIYGFAGERLTSKGTRGSYGTIFVEWENGRNTAHYPRNLKLIEKAKKNV